uniref:Uncharacterized protein n=1 Tax=Lygus hesperus TaxID=30085 RepID=A0A146LQI4_LYGHE
MQRVVQRGTGDVSHSPFEAVDGETYKGANLETAAVNTSIVDQNNRKLEDAISSLMSESLGTSERQLVHRYFNLLSDDSVIKRNIHLLTAHSAPQFPAIAVDTAAYSAEPSTGRQALLSAIDPNESLLNPQQYVELERILRDTKDTCFSAIDSAGVLTASNGHNIDSLTTSQSARPSWFARLCDMFTSSRSNRNSSSASNHQQASFPPKFIETSTSSTPSSVSPSDSTHSSHSSPRYSETDSPLPCVHSHQQCCSDSE